MAKIVKEKLYEDSFDEQKFLEDDDEKDDEKFEKGKPLGEQKVMELIQKYLPFLPNPKFESYGDRDNPNVSYGEDETYSYWDIVDIGCPELEEAMSGCTMIIGVPKEEEFNSDDDVTIKFYTDSVAFVGDYSDDEYTNWVEPISITGFGEEDWEETLKAMMEYHGLGEDEEDDFEDEMLTK